MNKQKNLGQVFTPDNVVSQMLKLCRWPSSKGRRVLEPACGDGAILQRLATAVPKGSVISALEIDHDLITKYHTSDPRVIPGNFVTHTPKELYTTIIANPPYVAAKDILPGILPAPSLKSANLYMEFIVRAIALLAPGGELVFLTPSNFLTATRAAKLNAMLVEQGGFTHFENRGDRIFEGASPFVCLWRWQKNRGKVPVPPILDDGQRVLYHGGFIHFMHDKRGNIPAYPISDIFDVKVGFTTGADAVFVDNATWQDAQFVGAGQKLGRVIESGSTNSVLALHRDRLEARYGKQAWNEWARDCYHYEGPRLYVDVRTRRVRFTVSTVPLYSGSVLALIPKSPLSRRTLHAWAHTLNGIQWDQTGFYNGGRVCFSPSSLGNFLL